MRKHNPSVTARTTLGRSLSGLDGDALDDAVELVGVAVDGKAVRGSRTGGKTAVHLLAAVLREGRAVISQLRGRVITADATHTRTGHAERVIARGGHDILAVKGNQRTLRRKPRHLPWREVHRLRVCTVRPGPFFPHVPARRAGHRGQAPPHRPHHREDAVSRSTSLRAFELWWASGRLGPEGWNLNDTPPAQAT